MAGNTADNTTLRWFLKKIEEQYGKAERIWVMDRGIPTEEVLKEMRESYEVRRRGVQEPERGSGGRPIHHQNGKWIEAHIFAAFMAYALHVTLLHRLRNLAPGLTPRAALEKFGAVQMIDVHLPTTDGRTVIISRYTQPEPELQVLLKQL